MNTTWKAVLGVILIFVFGWVTGAMSASVFIHHRVLNVLQRGPEAVATVLERRLTRNLDLDADQQKKMHEVLLDNITQRRVLQKQMQPQIQALNHDTMQVISTTLRPDQLEKFRANLQQLRERSGRYVLNTPEDHPAASEIGSPAGK